MWSSLLLLWTGAAQAGACCVGSTTTIPLRLGECERVIAGVGVSGETAIGRWDGDGASTSTSLADDAVVTTLAAGYRWDRRGQIGVSAPVRVNHKGVGDASYWGGGFGDVRVLATWDPIEEGRGPVPVFSAGVRLPTGRDWTASQGVVLEDVTGLEGPGANVGVSIERTMTKVPWAVALDAEASLTEHGVHPTLTASGGIGRTFGTGWSVLGTLRHVEAWTEGGGGSRTSLGARLTHGRPVAWRGWIGAETDIPVPGLGRSMLQLTSVGGGFAWIR